MLRHRRSCLLILGLMVAPVFTARAQAADIPKEIKTSATISAPQRDVIRAFVDSEFARLTDEDPAVQKRAREGIVNEVMVGSQPGEPAFVDVFVQALATKVPDALGEADNMHLRLNVAIIIAKLAERTTNARLVPLTVDVLNDKADPVVLWGLKAARFLVPAIIANSSIAGSKELMKAVVDVGSNRKTGYLVQDSYQVLMAGFEPANASAFPTARVPAIVGPLQDVLTSRVIAHQQGVVEEPVIEVDVITFLTFARVWAAQTEQEQVRTVDLSLKLLAATTSKMAAKEGDVSALERTAKTAATVLGIVGQNIKDGNIPLAAKPASQIIRDTPADEIAQRVANLYAAIKANRQFKGLTPPDQKPQLASAPAAAK